MWEMEPGVDPERSGGTRRRTSPGRGDSKVPPVAALLPGPGAALFNSPSSPVFLRMVQWALAVGGHIRSQKPVSKEADPALFLCSSEAGRFPADWVVSPCLFSPIPAVSAELAPGPVSPLPSRIWGFLPHSAGFGDTPMT